MEGQTHKRQTKEWLLHQADCKWARQKLILFHWLNNVWEQFNVLIPPIERPPTPLKAPIIILFQEEIDKIIWKVCLQIFLQKVTPPGANKRGYTVYAVKTAWTWEWPSKGEHRDCLYIHRSYYTNLLKWPLQCLTLLLPGSKTNNFCFD